MKYYMKQTMWDLKFNDKITGAQTFTLNLQSILVISKSKRLSELLRDIRSSTYHICKTEDKESKLHNHIHKEYVNLTT